MRFNVNWFIQYEIKPNATYDQFSIIKPKATFLTLTIIIIANCSSYCCIEIEFFIQNARGIVYTVCVYLCVMLFFGVKIFVKMEHMACVKDTGKRGEEKKVSTPRRGGGGSGDTSEFQSVRNVEGHPSRAKRAVSNIVRGCQKATRKGRQLFPSC